MGTTTEKQKLIIEEGSPSGKRDVLTLLEKQQVADLLTLELGSVLGGRELELQLAGSIGAKDSAHDVFVARTVQPDARGRRQAFACKRFRRLESAETEFYNTCHARARGFRTLQPAGEAIYDAGKSIGHVLVTEHIPRFTTMNQIGWQDYYAGQPEYERRIAEPLREIARFTALMHSKGITHHDWQLKNFAKVGAEPLLHDLEGSTFFTESEIGSPDFIDKSMYDLEGMLKSLVERGFLWDSTDSTFRNEITDNFFVPYLEQFPAQEGPLFEHMDHLFEEALTLRPQVHGKHATERVLTHT